MKIIIVGDGKVGYTLSDHLSREGHDITVIDNKSEALRRSIESLDVFTIKGNGASFSVLKEAGVREADLLIAATSTDEVNMLCCLFAKRLGAKHTIARMRDPEYNDQLESMKDDMRLSMIINPDNATAEEIMRLISFPSAIGVGTFADGQVLVVEYKVPTNSNIINISIAKAMQKYFADILICAVKRDGKIYIPKGDFILEEGDNIHITGTHDSIVEFMNKCGQFDKKIKSVILVGGGYITYYLSKILISKGYSVKIIEKKPEKCDELCERIPDALIIEGDGTDQELLDSERLEYTGAFVALTDMDEENLIMSMYASYKGVPKVIAKINRMGYAEVIKKAGIDSIISPKNITANKIVKYVRKMANKNEASGITVGKRPANRTI